MGTTEAITTRFGTYMAIKGRVSRAEFKSFQSRALPLASVKGILVVFVGDAVDPPLSLLVFLVGSVALLLVVAAELALMARRLHDTNRSGWWIPIPAGLGAVHGGAAVVGGLVVVGLLALPGDAEANRFGSPPEA